MLAPKLAFKLLIGSLHDPTARARRTLDSAGVKHNTNGTTESARRKVVGERGPDETYRFGTSVKIGHM